MNFTALSNTKNHNYLNIIENSNYIKISEFRDLLEENYIQEYEKINLQKLIVKKQYRYLSNPNYNLSNLNNPNNSNNSSNISNNLTFTNPKNYFMRTIDKNNKKKCPTVKFKISNNKIYSDNNIITDFNNIIISKSDKN